MAYTKQNYQPGDVLTAEQVNKIQDAIIVNEGNIEGHIENKSNPHGVTPAQIGAAPSGYGYGEKAEYIGRMVTMQDLETAVTPIINKMPDHTTKQVRLLDTTIGEYSCIATVYRHSASYVVVEVRVYATNYIYYKRLVGDVWQPREWLTCPQLIGLEYLTTEQWNGKPVYTKLVNIGALPNTAICQTDMGIQSNSTRIIGSEVSVLNNDRTALVNDITFGKEEQFIKGWNGNWFYSFTTTGNVTEYTATITIRYVKE